MLGKHLTNDEIMRFNHERKLNAKSKSTKTTKRGTKVLDESKSGSDDSAESTQEK